nr:hypothetical protein HK105_000272 [Polyrhizophydium stewartii]
MATRAGGSLVEADPESLPKGESDGDQVHKDTSTPQVYARIRRILETTPDVTAGLDSTPDHIEALRRAQAAVRNNAFPRPKDMDSPHLGRGFLERLERDGGSKILQLNRSVLHVEYTRFVEVCNAIKGLTLDEALLQLAWHDKPIGRRMRDMLELFIMQAKEAGFDLKRTYVAEAITRKNKAIVSEQLMKKYLRGRGRYGATPHIKSALIEVVLQERGKPFAVRLNDPLEWIRVRLRQRYAGIVPDAETVYEKMRTKRPVKPVFN